MLVDIIVHAATRPNRLSQVVDAYLRRKIKESVEYIRIFLFAVVFFL